MPRRTNKSKKLKQLEEKLKIIRREIQRRKKQNASSSPSKTKRSKKSNKSPFEECQALLDRIKKIQYSRGFLEPVDWKKLNIPTYPKIIKRPMDLSTVSMKLNSGKYATPYQFAVDMRLIYQNACTFNKFGTAFHIAAVKFAKKFEEEFVKKIVDQHETNDFTKRIAKAVATLIRHDDADAFRMPVDPQILEIPDYLEIIEHPMDLGTVANKISLYTQFKTFAADLYLVWDNCTKYNPKRNQIHQTALKLREYTTKQLGRICQSDFQSWQDDPRYSPDPYPPSTLSMHLQEPPNSVMMDHKHHQQTLLAPGPSGAHLQSDSDQNMQNQSMDPHPNNQDIVMANNDDIDHPMMNNEAVIASQKPAEIDIFKACDEMAEQDEEEANKMMINHLLQKQELNQEILSLDFRQKEELQRGIQCLDADHFEPLINMLQSFIPEGEGDDDEVELDVDAIDDPLQVKMYNYMLQAINQQEKERIQREGGDVNHMMASSQQPMVLGSLSHPPAMSESVVSMQQDNTMEVEEAEDIAHDAVQPEVSEQVDVVEDQQMNEVEQERQQMDTDQAGIREVDSFPVDSNMNNVQESSVEHDDAAEYTFGPTVDSNQEDQENVNQNEQTEEVQEMQQDPEEQQQNEMEEDGDIDMAENQEMNEEKEVNDGNHDIVADIANVVDAENNDTSTSLAMPVLESSTTEERREENQEQHGDGQNVVDDNHNVNDANVNQPDNELTDQEINDNDNNETPQSHVIPTMPALQPDDTTTSDMIQSQQNELENKNVENSYSQIESGNEVKSQDDGNDDDVLHKDMENNMNIQPAHDNNTNAVAMGANDDNEEDMNEEEEVDTPLADDIEF